MSKYVSAFIAGLVFSATAGVTIGAIAATNDTASNPGCMESVMPYRHVGTDSQVKIEMQEYRDGKQVATYAHVEGIDTSNIDPAARKLRVRVCVEPANDAAAPAAAK